MEAKHIRRGARSHAEAHARLAPSASTVGLHHAGRGPALRHQPRRPRPAIRDARGFPVARVTYQPGRHELAASKHHGRSCQSPSWRRWGREWTAATTSPGVGVPRHRAHADPREPPRHGHGADGRPTRATSVVDPLGPGALRSTTWWWPTPRSSSPRPGYGPTLPWWRWPPGPRTTWPAPRPADRTRTIRPVRRPWDQRTPRVSSMVPAMGPPPLATAATSGAAPAAPAPPGARRPRRAAGRRPRG